MNFFERLREKAACNLPVTLDHDISVERGLGVQATIEAFKEMIVGKPLIGYILGRPIVIMAFKAEVAGQDDLGEVKSHFTPDRYVPIDDWFDDLVQALQGRPCSCGACGPPLDNPKG